MLPWFTSEVEHLIILSVLSPVNGCIFPLDCLINYSRVLYIKDDSFLIPYLQIYDFGLSFVRMLTFGWFCRTIICVDSFL